MRLTILLNLLATVLVLFITELVFGAWLKQDSIRKTVPIVSFDAYYLSNNLYPQAPEKIHYRRDQFGLRGKYSDPAHIDILTLGGSTTDQRYITEGETWQDHLSQGLSRKAKREISVVNGGIDGRSTYGHLKDLQYWLPLIPSLSAKYYLLFVGINDLFTSPKWLFDEIGGEQRDFYSIFKNNSAFYTLYTIVSGNLQAHTYKMGHQHVDFSKVKWTSTPLLPEKNSLVEQRLKQYEARLEELDRLIKQRKARVIYVTQTVRAYRRSSSKQIEGTSEEVDWVESRKINGVDQYNLLSAINRKTMEVCQKYDGICLDLASELEFTDEDYYDFWHNSPSGAKKIGDYLSERLDLFFIKEPENKAEVKAPTAY